MRPAKVQPDVAAILMARNAAPTLARLLDHMEANEVPVTFIDHGSTDATREIAAERLGRSVVALIDEPFRGVFDLTRQLALKREIAESLAAGWIAHLDADEFPCSPRPDETLRAFLARQPGDGVEAVDCDEYVYLPLSEEDEHAPESFPETMVHCLRFRNRDRKQRFFRRGVPLDQWLRTGGHFVSWKSAPEAMPLHHYIGLSLDHLRSQYLGRVFSRGDIEKGWHFNRRALDPGFVRPPAPHGLLRREDALRGVGEAVARLPVFAPRNPSRLARPNIPSDTDLIIAAASPRALAAVRDILAEQRPRLRIYPLPEAAEDLPEAVPLLHVIEDGRVLLPGPRAELARGAAAEWCRFVAAMRQEGLRLHRYAELRMEDLRSGHADLAEAVENLLHGEGRRCDGFDGPGIWRDPPPGLNAEAVEAFEALAGPLLRDLSYAPPSGA
jgi:hypothetical protein